MEGLNEILFKNKFRIKILLKRNITKTYIE